MKKVNILEKYSRHFFLLWTILTMIGLSIPGRDLPDIDIVGIDKVVHLIIFGTWTFLFMASKFKFTNSHHILISVAFAILTEVYQHFLIANRTGDVYDVLFNILGIMIGYIAFKYYKSKYGAEVSSSDNSNQGIKSTIDK